MSVDDQADTFMRAFLTDFAGNFEEVLEAAFKYKAALAQLGKSDDGSEELSAVEAALFLESTGFVKTAAELKEFLTAADLDNNGHMSFIEFALLRYGKDPVVLVNGPPYEKLHPVLQTLVLAQQNYAKFLSEQKVRTERMEALRVASEAGGFAGGRARVELAQMEREDETLVRKQEVAIKLARTKAERHLKANDPYEAEQARIRKIEEEKRVKLASKKAAARARIAQFQSQIAASVNEKGNYEADE